MRGSFLLDFVFMAVKFVNYYVGFKLMFAGSRIVQVVWNGEATPLQGGRCENDRVSGARQQRFQ